DSLRFSPRFFMAKSSSSKSSSSGETKAPLVIALVFFVLATIGLGVFAYTSNEDLAAAKGDAKKSEDSAKAANASAQKAKDEALIYKAALGVLKPDEMAALQGISQYRTEAQTAHKAMMDALAAKANQPIQDQVKNFVVGGAACWA